MNPRRHITPDQSISVEPIVRHSGQQWRRIVSLTLAVVFITAGLVVNCLIVSTHEQHHRRAIQTAAVLADVRSFMTMYTAHDPFHANDYVDHVLAWATGDFLQEYQKKVNEILLGIARNQPTTGTVIDLALERWTDDGAASVLVVTNVQYVTPDGKQHMVVPYRCVVTAVLEGERWKISSLTQVI